MLLWLRAPPLHLCSIPINNNGRCRGGLCYTSKSRRKERYIPPYTSLILINASYVHLLDLLHYAEDLHIGNHGDPVPYPWVEWFDHVHPPAPPTSTQLPILPRNPDSLLAWPNSLNTTTKSTNKTQRRTISLPTIAQKNLISRQRQTNRQKHPKLPTV